MPAVLAGGTGSSGTIARSGRNSIKAYESEGFIPVPPLPRSVTPHMNTKDGLLLAKEWGCAMKHSFSNDISFSHPLVKIYPDEFPHSGASQSFTRRDINGRLLSFLRKVENATKRYWEEHDPPQKKVITEESVKVYEQKLAEDQRQPSQEDVAAALESMARDEFVELKEEEPNFFDHLDSFRTLIAKIHYTEHWSQHQSGVDECPLCAKWTRSADFIAADAFTQASKHGELVRENDRLLDELTRPAPEPIRPVFKPQEIPVAPVEPPKPIPNSIAEWVTRSKEDDFNEMASIRVTSVAREKLAKIKRRIWEGMDRNERKTAFMITHGEWKRDLSRFWPGGVRGLNAITESVEVVAGKLGYSAEFEEAMVDFKLSLDEGYRNKIQNVRFDGRIRNAVGPRVMAEFEAASAQARLFLEKA